MNILKNLSIKNLKINKKRTIGTIIGIILSSALITAVVSMGVNFRKTLLDENINRSGYYHLNINNLNQEDIDTLNKNRRIAKTTIIYELDNIILKEYPVNTYAMDQDTFNERAYKLVSGSFPKNSNEILLSESILSENNYRVGDEIEASVLTENGVSEAKKYKIVGGVKQEKIGFLKYIITTGEKSNTIDAFIILNNPKNYKVDILSILGEDTTNVDESWKKVRDYNYESKNYGSTYTVNDGVLRYEVLAFNDATVTSLIIVISIVLLIIVVTSIFCIHNSFAIATTEKIKLYGMLISVGATKKQIRKNVLDEGFILGLIAIPIGIICGYLASFVLVIIMNLIMGGMFDDIEKIEFSLNLLPAFLAIVLSTITIYFSALTSAIKASHTSPIQQLRNAGDVKIKSKKLKTPKFISKFFKTGGVLAYKNLKRSKKKYRTTVISLSVSILVFIALSTFVGEFFSASEDVIIVYDYNILVSARHGFEETDVDRVKRLGNIDAIYKNYAFKDGSTSLQSYDYDHMTTSNPLSQDCTSSESGEEICGPDYLYMTMVIYDTETFKDYCHKAKINYDEVKGKIILNDTYAYQDDNGKTIKNRIFNYQKGDNFEAVLNDKQQEFTIGAITDKNPYGYEEIYNLTPLIIVENTYFAKDELRVQTIFINSSNPTDTVSDIKEINPTFVVSNVNEYVESMRSLSLIVSIFLYGFITVITLIGVTNIFNTITSNMELRQKEFAMLKSIGMTKKEFNRMINLETLFYSFKSLFYGIVIGTALSYLIHLGISKSITIRYHLPILPIVICIIFVILLVSIIMKYSINKINRQNTIETIRNDNV